MNINFFILPVFYIFSNCKLFTQSNTVFLLIIQTINISEMKAQTFQQKRMVELSRDLDNERQKNKRLIKQTQELSDSIKDHQKEINDLNNEIATNRQTISRLEEAIRSQNNAYKIMQLQNQQFKEKNTKIEFQNVRQRQKMDELKEQLLKYQNTMKDILFTKQRQLTEKEKQNFKLRQQNIEVEKLYLKQREQFQKQKQAYFRSLTKLKIELDTLKKDLSQVPNYFNNLLSTQKHRNSEKFNEINAEIKRIQGLIRDEKKYKAEIRELKRHLEEVVAENSQKIIELYRYKNYV